MCQCAHGICGDGFYNTETGISLVQASAKIIPSLAPTSLVLELDDWEEQE